jgi:hypothetical protein
VSDFKPDEEAKNKVEGWRDSEQLVEAEEEDKDFETWTWMYPSALSLLVVVVSKKGR